MIVDVHTHAFPADAQASPSGWAARQREAHWEKLVAPRNEGSSIQGWAGFDEFKKTMEEDGIDHCVLLGWYWENPDSCHQHNREVAEWLTAGAGRFSAFAAVHPSGGSASEWIATARENQFIGFGELLPALQGSSLDAPFWNELAEGAAEAGLWFNFHVTEPVGRAHPGRIETPFHQLQAFIERHPDLRIILSHWGGGLFLGEMNPFVRGKFRNVWYDCSASPLLYDDRIFEIAVRTVGAGKILFGSDFPLRLYPRRKDNPGWKRFLASIARTNLTEQEKKNILGENAARLFGL